MLLSSVGFTVCMRADSGMTAHVLAASADPCDSPVSEIARSTCEGVPCVDYLVPGQPIVQSGRDETSSLISHLPIACDELPVKAVPGSVCAIAPPRGDPPDLQAIALIRTTFLLI